MRPRHGCTTSCAANPRNGAPSSSARSRGPGRSPRLFSPRRSAEQRETLQRLREEFVRAAREIGPAAQKELEEHEAQRRRALHEVADRLRQRERELRERIAAEETEAVRRIQAGFADVERRQIEQLSRIVDRTAIRLAESSVEEFSKAVKGGREDAARRLSRELDRAVA